MDLHFKHERIVEFCETDTAGIVHFSNFFRYMESAEQAFMRSLGFSVHGQRGDKMVGFPRVHVACDFKKPLHFEDRVQIGLSVRHVRDKSIVYDFVFYHADQDDAEALATGTMTVACVAVAPDNRQIKATKVPDELVAAIKSVTGA